MRRVIPVRSGGLACVLAAAILMGVATDVQAQARVIVAPSLSVGFVYDDNLFYQASGDFEAIWRLTSGMRVSRETQRSALFADLSFDVERFRERPDLSSPLARQNAALRLRSQVSPRVTIDLEGGFDSTRAPTELNLTTGLLTGRRRAFRFYGGPGFTVVATPRLKVDAAYDFSADVIPEGALLISDRLAGDAGEVLELQAPASRLMTHVASSRVTYDLSPRHAFRLDYVGRLYVPGDPDPVLPVFDPDAAPGAPALPPVLPVDAERFATHTALVGWTFRINPAVKFEVAAGPRFGARRPETALARAVDDERPFGLDGFEAEALLSRQRTTHDVFLSYTRTVASAIGLTTLLDIDRGLLRAVYRPPFGVQSEAEVGFYRSAVDNQRVRVFHIGGGLTIPLGGPVSFAASYSADFQHGRFGLDPTLPAIALTDPGNPLLLVDPDAPMRRSVALLRLIIAPQLRRAPEDPPPGATPVRRPPVKRSDK